MIQVRFTHEVGRMGMTMEGHAGHGHGGPDIVCAGASAIAYALYGYLVNAVPPGWLEDDVCSDGYMRLACPAGDDVAAAFKMTEIGLRQIGVAYPGCVEFI